MNSHSTPPPGISFFGPKGAGKSVLLRAFLRSLKSNGLLRGLSHSGLSIVAKVDGTEINVYSQNFTGIIPPTAQMQFEELEFGRTPDAGYENQYPQKLSAKTHLVRTYDTAGGNFSLLADPNLETIDILQQVPRYGIEAADDWIHLQDSLGIIVVLDPTKVRPSVSELGTQENQLRLQGNYRDVSLFTYEEYARIVAKLADDQWLSTLGPNGKKRLFAICILKTDQLPSGRRKLTADELLYKYKIFGQEMIDEITRLKRKYENRVRVFGVSSFGYDVDNQPNYDPQSGWLKSSSQPIYWKPENAHRPFLWLFEQLDLDLLRHDTDNVIGKIFRLGNTRENDYIPYLLKKP